MAGADDWMPRRLEFQQQWLCRWFSLAGQRFVEPFFEDTVAHCLKLVPNGKPWRSFSSLDYLCEAASHVDAVAPTAFIFHVSRCGSTLLGQLLGLNPAHIVLSEVPVLDQILRLPLHDAAVSSDDAGRWLRAAVALLGRRRFGETRLFIKLDSWHFHFAGQLRELYPDTPFVQLGRAPLEVWRSQRQQAGLHAAPGAVEPALFGLSDEGARGHDMDSYLGAVLANYYSHMARLQQDPLTLTLDYSMGAEPMMRRISSRLAMGIDAASWDAIRERCRFHSKRPLHLFGKEPAGLALPASLEQAAAIYRSLHA